MRTLFVLMFGILIVLQTVCMASNNAKVIWSETKTHRVKTKYVNGVEVARWEFSKKNQQKLRAPVEASYRIIGQSTFLHHKRSLDIRVNRKLTRQELIVIGNKLKTSTHKQYARTFICYYLPGMKAGSGAWAVTHFDPDLRVQILGTGIAQKEMSVEHKRDNSVAVKNLPRGAKSMGRWLNEADGTIYVFCAYRDSLYLQRIFTSGSSSFDEMLGIENEAGLQFYFVGKVKYGNYFKVLPDGKLGIYDLLGLIVFAKKI